MITGGEECRNPVHYLPRSSAIVKARGKRSFGWMRDVKVIRLVAQAAVCRAGRNRRVADGSADLCRVLAGKRATF